MKYFLSVLAVVFIATNAAISASITVNNCGQELRFDTPPKRMVVHDINISEMAFALGLQDRIVGLTGISGWYKVTSEFEKKRGDIPELAPKYPTLENLVAAEPDLFLAGWYYGMKPGGDVTPETLSPYGIKTLILTESCIHLDKSRLAASLDLLYNDILRLGTIFGKEAHANLLIDDWRAKIANIQQRISDRKTKRVFLYDSGEDKPFTAGKYAMPTAMIAAAGGVNVTADMEISWGPTSWESVAVANPEFFIFLDYQNGRGAGELLEFLKAHPVMKDTDGIRNGRFVALRYEELTPGPANIAAIDKIARAMYPDAF